MVSPWGPIGVPFALFVELVGTCGIPLGAFGHTCVALGVLWGILWDLLGLFLGPFGDLSEAFLGFCGIPLGTSWEPLGSTGSAPGGRAGITCDSLGVLGDPL